MILSGLLRADRLRIAPLVSEAQSLLLLLLPPETREHPHAPSLPRAARTAAPIRAAPPSSSPLDATVVHKVQAPSIDWQHESQVAIDAALAKAEQEQAYRNLASLSPEQLNWVRQNHLVPAKPGIPWKYRRVEVTPGGFPIIHINDHCIAIPFLMMMVFCQVGHIEPDGRLFEHMRDPREP
jgi:hypothetical protein